MLVFMSDSALVLWHSVRVSIFVLFVVLYLYHFYLRSLGLSMWSHACIVCLQ